MNLIVAVIQDRDADAAVAALTSKSYRMTRIGTTGGFLQQGNTTLLIGVDEAAVNDVIGVLRSQCRRREMFVPMAVGGSDQSFGLTNPIGVEVGGATVFVLEVEQFAQL